MCSHVLLAYLEDQQDDHIISFYIKHTHFLAHKATHFKGQNGSIKWLAKLINFNFGRSWLSFYIAACNKSYVYQS